MNTLADFLAENYTIKELKEMPIGSLKILIRSIKTYLKEKTNDPT